MKILPKEDKTKKRMRFPTKIHRGNTPILKEQRHDRY
jgi:hypothetical protein